MRKYSEKCGIEYEDNGHGAVNFFFNQEEYTLTVPYNLYKSPEECNEEALEGALNYLQVNEKEKNSTERRYDKINEKNYILIEIDSYEDCFFKDIDYKKLEEAYEHSGIQSTYYIIRGQDGYLSYNPYFYNICFEQYTPGRNAVYFKNTGKECLFINLAQNEKYLVKPGEQIKICKKNQYKHIKLFEGYGIKVSDWKKQLHKNGEML